MENDINSYWMNQYNQKLASIDNQTDTPAATPEKQKLGVQNVKTAVSQNPYPGEPWMDSNVINPIIAQENPRGITNDRSGDAGKAWGILQQRQVFVDEANAILEKWRRQNSGDEQLNKKYKEYADRFKEYDKKFTHEDSDIPKKAIDMYRIVLQDRFNQFKKAYGREPNATEMSSIHHTTSIHNIKNDKVYTDAVDKKRMEMATNTLKPSSMMRPQTEKPYTYQDYLNEQRQKKAKKK